VIKIVPKNYVFEHLKKDFPKANSANKQLEKYCKYLESLINSSILNGRNPYQVKLKRFSAPLKELGDKGGRIGGKTANGTKVIRIHKWLSDNGYTFFHAIEYGSNLNGVISEFNLSEHIDFEVEDIYAKLESMTKNDLDFYIDNFQTDDLSLIKRHLPKEELSQIEISNLYDSLEIDQISLKNYIKQLLTNKTLNIFKRKNICIQAYYLLRYAQYTKGTLYQLKSESIFGRNYYKGISVQNIHTTLREAIVGDSYEYDIKSCAISWRIAFAEEFYKSIKDDNKSINEIFETTFFYLTNKQEFYNDIKENVFDSNCGLTDAEINELLKDIFTSLNFGARLTARSWKDKLGNNVFAAVEGFFREYIEDYEPYHNRFLNDVLVKRFNDEQNLLSQYICKRFKKEYPYLDKIKELKKDNFRTNQSKLMAYLFQHAETYMMDTVREELYKLNIPILANIHDAIIVRHKIPTIEKERIEKLVRSKFSVHFFRLGEERLHSVA